MIHWVLAFVLCAGTAARQRGVPLEVAMHLSDHKDVATALKHYRAISPEELLKAVGRSTQEENRTHRG